MGSFLLPSLLPPVMKLRTDLLFVLFCLNTWSQAAVNWALWNLEPKQISFKLFVWTFWDNHKKSIKEVGWLLCLSLTMWLTCFWNWFSGGIVFISYKIFLYFIYFYIHACIPQVCGSLCRQSDSLELNFQVLVGHWMWVLRIELWSSARIAIAPNCWATSPSSIGGI